ncbi:MAG: transketolase [Armatimonadota bacterium]|nr:transketolase [Armatimonadota bacterium]MDR7533441.1 transketolase [Armatimonadota bacterium]MDR7536255.1 transketolase [Armatimonadota bacterium]
MTSTAALCALEARAREFRKTILQVITTAGSGHPGGSLSAIDILTVLYYHTMRHDPHNPTWPDRDRFVLSKGHGCPAWYVVLAACGYFAPEHLWTLRRVDSILQGHPDMTRTPGVEISSGSLGMGFSAAIGMALAGKRDGRPYRVYAMLGDGECQEGAVWEGAMFAAHYGLDNLTAIVDRNGLQQTGPTEERIRLDPLGDKWRACTWDVQEIDGHDLGAIVAALDRARTVRGRPQVIVARTIKGKGVSFLEGVVGFHGKALTHDELARALAELDGAAPGS